jgi:two-component system LytT family response regulator
MKIRAVIVDDDEFVREELKDLIRESFSNDLELVGDFEHPLEAIESIRKIKPDLVFADIQMPVMNGFEMLDHLDTGTFEVIFITSFNQYAIRAIRYSALDYLLKPIKAEDLHAAILRYKQRTEKILTSARLANLKHNFNTRDEKDFQLIIPTKHGEHQFTIPEIVNCEADSNYTMIHLVKNRKFLASKTLSDIEAMLPQDKFIRIHKSHLVNLQHIEKISSNDEVVLTNQEVIAISRRRLTEVKLAIKGYNQDTHIN